MIFFFSLVLFESTLASACKIKTSRGTFDLTPIGGVSHEVPSSDPYNQQQKYYFSFCGNSADTTECVNTIDPVCAVQVSDIIGTCYELASWDNSYTATPTSDGFSLEFENGSDKLCVDPNTSKNFPRSVDFIFKCSTKELGDITSDESDDEKCKYQVTVPTKYVCDEYIINSSGRAGLSDGSIFLIILLVLITVYCIGGFGFNKFKSSAEGVEAVPQYSFWCTQLPFWVKSGCLASWACSVGLCMRIRQKITGVSQVNRGGEDTDADGTYENLD